jgi:uncharacterized membrane protein
MNMKTKNLTKIALIAAIYAVLTLVLAPISYGFIQFRVSEMLTVLPFLFPGASWGLFIGCALANIYSGLGIYDVVFGSLATLAAGFLTAKMPSPLLAPLPPVIINAVVIGAMWSIFAEMPFYLTAAYVGLGQLGVCYLLGYPLLIILRKRYPGLIQKIEK